MGTGEPVVVYTQDGCADSRRVLAWLRGRGATVEERNVSREPAHAEALAATGWFMTPVAVVGLRTVAGPRFADLADALAAEGGR